MTSMHYQKTAYMVAAALLAGSVLLPFGSPVRAQEPETITEDNIIAGTMDIDFRTRTEMDTSGSLVPGSAALGARDKYKFSLRVGKTTEFAGSIYRQPNLYSKLLHQPKQSASLSYDVGLSVLNPRDLTQKKNVGKWVGMVPIDTSGVYHLAGGKADERPLRIAVDTVGSAKGFTDLFGGDLVGKAEKKENLASYTYRRLVAGKEIQIQVKRVDPMRFDNIELAKGPSEIYPHTLVTGRLDYDYETGNWYTDGIHFKYGLNGKDYDDVVTGSIKWLEDPDRKENGKGHYDFNLRFNEDKNKKPTSEGAAFSKMSDEEAFFAVDTSVPSFTGRIDFIDTMIPGKEAPSASKITYALNAHNLTKQQIMNFFKLWMLAVGPTNDE